MLAGKEYGTGSSRDWAAKGTLLLGVRAVIAESFERIHRSNLVGMGVLPLEFEAGRVADEPRPHRRETFEVTGIEARRDAALDAHGGRHGARTGRRRRSEVRCRIDTPVEAEYFRHGGILPYVLRKLRAQG